MNELDWWKRVVAVISNVSGAAAERPLHLTVCVCVPLLLFYVFSPEAAVNPASQLCFSVLSPLINDPYQRANPSLFLPSAHFVSLSPSLLSEMVTI